MASKDRDGSESVAILIKVEKDRHCPPSTKVIDNTVKILFVFADGEQRLITYDTQGNVECTVQDLLDVTDIPVDEEVYVSSLMNNPMHINYIVEVGLRETRRSRSPEF